jgi:hypothetical protein
LSGSLPGSFVTVPAIEDPLVAGGEFCAEVNNNALTMRKIRDNERIIRLLISQGDQAKAFTMRATVVDRMGPISSVNPVANVLPSSVET